MKTWKDALEALSYTVTFEELGMPEWKVRIRRADSLLLGDLLELSKQFPRSERSGEEMSEAEMIELQNKLGLELLAKLIAWWNLPDFDDPTQTLKLPSEDPTVLQRMPTAYVNFLVRITSQELQSVTNPPGAAAASNSSGPS